MILPPSELTTLLIKAGAVVRTTPNTGKLNDRSITEVKIGPYSARSCYGIEEALSILLRKISDKDLETRIGNKGK